MLVLIAKDYEPLREMFAKVVQTWGHEVITAKNGRQAVQRLGESDPDVVITDCDMGDDRTGHQVARLAKRLNPAVRVMLMSGEERAPGEADVFILKPVELDSLRKFIEGQ